MRIWIGVLALLSASLVGCAASDNTSVEGLATETSAASPTPGVSDADRAALLAQADRLADEHQGRAVQVVAVRTKSSNARAITGWSEQAPDEDVWVLAVSGDDYFCQFCSGPSDDGKQSKHLTLTVRAEHPTDERLTFGMSQTPYDLSAFGSVHTLRGDSRGSYR